MLALSQSQQVSTSHLYLSVYVHLYLHPHLHLHLCAHCVAKLQDLALTLDMLRMFAMFDMLTTL